MRWLGRDDETTGTRRGARPAREETTKEVLAEFFSQAAAATAAPPAVAEAATVQAAVQAPVVVAPLPTFESEAPTTVVPVVSPLAAAPRTIVSPEIDIDFRWEHASYPCDGEPVADALVTLTPSGGVLVDPATGPVAHVVLALDLSASMNHPAKYPVLQRALATMLSDLREPDAAEVRLTVVAFGRGAEVIASDQSSRRLQTGALLSAIEASKLRFSNYTDIGGAVELACAAAARSHQADRRLPIRVVVLTDGNPQDVPTAERAMARMRQVPADLDCLCFGDDADVEGMKRLVCGGRGGTVKHVTPDTIAQAFGRIAETAQRVVAKRALLDIELRDGVTGGRAYRFRPGRHDFGPRAFADGVHFATDLGTIEDGRAYSLVLRLRLPAASEPGETEVGRVLLRIPGERGPRTYERMVWVPRHAGAAKVASDPVVRQALEIVGTGPPDVQAQLRALRARRDLHVAERRDARSIAVIERAIGVLENGGSMDDLTPGERAVLQAHTRTVHGGVSRPAGTQVR